MVITKMALPRRTFLRGMGAAIALPFLDSMVPALRAAAPTAKRLAFFYVPNGMYLPNFHPTGPVKGSSTRRCSSRSNRFVIRSPLSAV